VTETPVRPLPRHRPPEAGTERETLTGMLDFLRATVVNKVAGLDDEQAFSRPTVSSLSPGALVKHLSGVERFWFSIDFAGLDAAWPWPENDPHGNFRIEPGESIAGIAAEYIAECERSRQAIVGSELNDLAKGEGQEFTLRYALAHMIEETARHCGHLDLLRESIDGATGQ
jgi:hypothetical protein